MRIKITATRGQAGLPPPFVSQRILRASLFNDYGLRGQRLTQRPLIMANCQRERQILIDNKHKTLSDSPVCMHLWGFPESGWQQCLFLLSLLRNGVSTEVQSNHRP